MGVVERWGGGEQESADCEVDRVWWGGVWRKDIWCIGFGSAVCARLSWMSDGFLPADVFGDGGAGGGDGNGL